MNPPIRSLRRWPLVASATALAASLALAAGEPPGTAPAGAAPSATAPASAGAGMPAAPAAGAPSAAGTTAAPASAAAPVSSYQPDRFGGRAGRYYAAAWGIDSLNVRLVESGELIRFSWHVIDPRLAAPLNDKRLKPALIDGLAGVSLVVPEMANVGMLRQTATPEADRRYWVVFSNKGRLVKRGHRVDVVIGPFHAANLVVD